MKKKQISLPNPINFRILVILLQSKVGVISTNWISQAMRHMTPAERLHRIILELITISFLYFLLIGFLSNPIAIIVALIVAHSGFFVFNGQIYTLKRYLSDNLISSEDFLSYVENMRPTLQGHFCLEGVLAFGSLSNGPISESSDFDVRLVRKTGFFNALKAANLCTRERYRAFWGKFPIDIIICTADELVMSDDEPAIVLDDPNKLFAEYPAGTEDFETFMIRMRTELAKRKPVT